MALENWDEFVALMQSTASQIFQRESAGASVISSGEIFNQTTEPLLHLLGRLPAGTHDRVDYYHGVATGPGAHLGYASDSSACHSLAAYILPSETDLNPGLASVASLLVDKRFLWDEIRLSAQAYGQGFAYYDRQKTFIAGSFRDSNPIRSLEVFSRIGEYLATGNITPDQIDSAKIRLIGNRDRPQYPISAGAEAFDNDECGYTNESRQQVRDAILNATREEIAAVGEMLSSIPRGATFIHGPRKIIEQVGLEEIR